MLKVSIGTKEGIIFSQSIVKKKVDSAVNVRLPETRGDKVNMSEFKKA